MAYTFLIHLRSIYISVFSCSAIVFSSFNHVFGPAGTPIALAHIHLSVNITMLGKNRKILFCHTLVFLTAFSG